jgi:hypothetical protein
MSRRIRIAARLRGLEAQRTQPMFWYGRIAPEAVVAAKFAFDRVREFNA